MEIVKLYPECKDNIWGGVKLEEKYGKKTDKFPVAESWELSFHPDGLTRLENGKTLQDTATAADLGENCKDFPLKKRSRGIVGLSLRRTEKLN